MSNRAVSLSLVFLALGGVMALWCDTAMLWDGAFQFCESLLSGRAFAYLSRFHSWVVWQPMMALARHGAGLRTLKLAYGAPYCLAPLVGAALSWWVVRRSAPHLMIWALLGTALAPLPGQIFMINDSIFQLHLFWPVFLGALLPLTGGQRGVLAAVSLFQLSHPLGIGLCLMTAAFAAGRRWLDGQDDPRATLPARWPERIRWSGWSGWFVLLALLGVAKLLIWPDPYAASEATWEQVVNTYRGGVRGWPAAGVCAVWLATALLVWSARPLRSTTAARLGQVAFALVCVAGLCWFYVAADPLRWRGALNFRRWVAPASLPLFLAVAFEIWHLRGLAQLAAIPAAGAAWRQRTGVAAAGIFLLVLGTESRETGWLFQRLEAEVQPRTQRWVFARDFPWIEGTALEHWGLPAQVLMVQGRRPHTLLWPSELPEDATASVESHGGLLLGSGPAVPMVDSPACWFQWGELRSGSALPAVK